jgi:hypothetical protein
MSTEQASEPHRRYLSSQITFLQKFLIPCIPIAIGMGVLMMNDGFIPFFWPAIILVIAGTTVMAFRTEARLKQVILEAGGEALTISNFFRAIRIPVSAIARVETSSWLRRRYVWLTLSTDTPFGRQVVFMPPQEGFGFSKSPVVELLRRLSTEKQAAPTAADTPVLQPDRAVSVGLLVLVLLFPAALVGISVQMGLSRWEWDSFAKSLRAPDLDRIEIGGEASVLNTITDPSALATFAESLNNATPYVSNHVLPSRQWIARLYLKNGQVRTIQLETRADRTAYLRFLRGTSAGGWMPFVGYRQSPALYEWLAGQGLLR